MVWRQLKIVDARVEQATRVLMRNNWRLLLSVFLGCGTGDLFHVDDGIESGPVLGLGSGNRAQGEDAAIGAGNQFTIFRLAQREYIAAVETGVHLMPVPSTIGGDEDATEFLVIDEAGVERGTVILVDDDRGNLAMAESAIGGNE